MTGILQDRLPFALGLLPGCGDDPRTLLVGPAARLGQQGVARLGGFAENPAALALGGSRTASPSASSSRSFRSAARASSSDRSIYALRSSIARTITGKPYRASTMKTTANASVIQKRTPASGCKSPMIRSDLNRQSARKQTTTANSATPSIRAATIIMFVRTLPAASG